MSRRKFFFSKLLTSTVSTLMSCLVLCLFLLTSFSFYDEWDMRPSAVMIEICDNGIDDDGDGQIDLNDDACDCPIIEPKSLIPNPSFEDRNCCPQGRAELSCATGWIQASAPTTDYIHTCGWAGPDNYEPPKPFPDGDGVMGFRDGRVGREGRSPNLNWKEYAGACLINPLEVNTAYRFEFDVGFLDFQKSPATLITFFGTTDCAYLPFGGSDDEFGCPTNDPNWIRLGATRLTGNNSWVRGTIDVTPEETITAIAIGPDCPGVASSVNLYYYFDNLILDDARSFEFRITEVNHPCAEDFTLEILEDELLSYQWYKEGIALLGETNATLSRIHGEGAYQVRVIGPNSCRTTKAFNYSIPTFATTDIQTTCINETYAFGTKILDESGIYIDTFKTVNNCDSIVTLDLTILPELQGFDHVKIFEGETFHLEQYSFKSKGQHEALIISDIGCDSLVTLNLEYYQLYFPNIFSPNGDGQNDHFRVFGNADLMEIKRLTMYDRWGQKVYDDFDLFESEGQGWRGRKNGKVVEPGIYAYVITVLMDDGKERSFKGSVLVQL